MSRTLTFPSSDAPALPIVSLDVPDDWHVLSTTAALLATAKEVAQGEFRPNVVVDWPDGAQAVPEEDWIGRDIRLGDVVLRGREPCVRCGFIMIEQDGLPLDPDVLRTVVKRYGRNFGIYCDVVTPGEIAAGYAVRA